MNPSVSPTLEIRKTGEGDRICCRNCAHPLAPSGESWKSSSIVSESPTDRLCCEADNGTGATILRLFVCRNCGALLDSETALPGEPFLDDIVRI